MGWRDYLQKPLAEAKISPADHVTTSTGLQDWFNAVQCCKSATEVFALLDKFRPLEWTDEQRAQMSRAYITRLSQL